MTHETRSPTPPAPSSSRNLSMGVNRALARSPRLFSEAGAGTRSPRSVVEAILVTKSSRVSTTHRATVWPEPDTLGSSGTVAGYPSQASSVRTSGGSSAASRARRRISGPNGRTNRVRLSPDDYFGVAETVGHNLSMVDRDDAVSRTRLGKTWCGAATRSKAHPEDSIVFRSSGGGVLGPQNHRLLPWLSTRRGA